jgi:hypothetical protein
LQNFSKKMTVQERVAELIFQLRDQNGEQRSQPGRCDVFLDPRKEKSPAHQLVKLGFDAVPALIDALGDRRLTRSVGFHRDFYFSHYALTVADCARAVLAQIAARDFYRWGTISTEESSEAARREARAWWEQVQKKGEKQVLVDGVESDDVNCLAQAERLLAKFPDAALPAIAHCAPKATLWERQQLIDLAAEVKGESPVPFLLQEMNQDPDLDCRVAAARGLASHDHRESLEAMIAEWKKLSAMRTNKGDDAIDGSAVQNLIGFLAGSGSPDAVRALSEGLQKHSVNDRLAVVSAFGPSGNVRVFSIGAGGSIKPVEAKDGGKALADVIEDLLVRALDDSEQRMGVSATWGDKSFSDPRIGDVAGHVLWTRWPKKYTFDISASTAVRDRQRLELKNVWRKEHGLPPLEQPKPPQDPR